MTTKGEGDNDSGMQKFELYIKASAIDRETKGADPICQQFFMITCLLGEYQDDVDFKVFTVQADCPPKNFAAGWSKKYPVIMVNQGRNKSGSDISGMMYDTFEELEIFFEGINRECPELKRKNQPNILALKVVENLFKKFNHFIAGNSPQPLLSELKDLNSYLEAQETKFMVDNVLSFADCHLLPRLQHIVVAGKAYRQFEIPKEMTHIWKYLKNAYEQDAFKSTMPSDQDIIMSYEKKCPTGLPKLVGQKWHRIALENFTYTTDIPQSILEGLASLATTNGSSSSQQQQECDSPPEDIMTQVQEAVGSFSTSNSDTPAATENTQEQHKDDSQQQATDDTQQQTTDDSLATIIDAQQATSDTQQEATEVEATPPQPTDNGDDGAPTLDKAEAPSENVGGDQAASTEGEQTSSVNGESATADN